MARKDKGHDENTVHETIVLEVNVINDEQPRRKNDGQCNDLSCTSRLQGGRVDKGLKRPDQNKFRDDNGGALKVNCLPALVVEVVDLDHEGIDEAGDVGHHPFEIGEEGGVIQGPFRGALRVPFLQRKTVCDGEPVAVNLKVG